MIYHKKISNRGHIVIPAPLRQSLGLEPGENIIMREHNGELHIMSLRQAVHQIQNLAQSRIPDDVSLVDDLLAMRREEVRSEAESD